ncbi:STAS domain-containing protein [Rhizobacter sp. J219]|jgi:phospholipid transport system transporter-binding protein|uniref:STAS domain-containing protein n=1 Tax=Rhizobacter sp. J219 TaxID=2898430 RepID=UPI002150D251|nr:STAS domain-containing protein [Rhizobacter sp. J219]MCR5885528.1 STAS domain-containing protein [Rhizobacter sp. J219]
MLVLPATVTLQEARDAQRMLSQALQQEAQSEAHESLVMVDASGLQQFDSSALAVLLECQRLATGWGKGFAVRNAPKKLAELARLYGVDVLLMPPEDKAA